MPEICSAEAPDCGLGAYCCLHPRELVIKDDDWRLSGNKDALVSYLADLANQPDEVEPFRDQFDWAALICEGDPCPIGQTTAE
jgi:hypothetical protein